MSDQNVQHMLVDTICGLFRDPQSAAAYAQAPHAYLADKMEGYDMSGVDMPAAVSSAVQQSNLPPEMAEAVTNVVYQPAPSIRVPVPREGYADPNYGKDYKVDDYKVDDYKVDDYKGEDHKVDHDRDPMDTDRPLVEMEPKLDSPPVLEHTPPGYQHMDDGGYCMEPPADYTPETYSPATYTPTIEMDLDCVEYSVSNCVTTVHHDRPEIADKLCETRNYDDPYDRVDPSHSYGEATIVQHPDYDYQPHDQYVDKPWYDENYDKPDYDHKPVEDYGNGHAEPEYAVEPEMHHQPEQYVEPEMHHEPEPYVEPEMHHEEPAPYEPEPEMHQEPEPMDNEMMAE